MRNVLNNFIQVSTHSIRGEITTFAVSSMFKLGNFLKENKINHSFLCTDSPDTSHNLNVLANEFYRDKSKTHLLLIDYELKFEPEMVLELVKQNVGLACGVLPDRRVSLKSVYEGALQARVQDAATASHELQSREPIFRRVDGTDLGFALIRRDVLEKMVERSITPVIIIEEEYDETDKFRRPPIKLYGFFSYVYDDLNRNQFESAAAFCHRWTKLCGGKIVATDDFELSISGPILSFLKFEDVANKDALIGL